MNESNPASAAATEVVVIGAGPYGLSIAAHLRARGIPYRIFGDPMSAWSKQMPKGMHLKSEGFASSLSEPAGAFTLGRFCEERNLPYADLGLPVPLQTFVDYGLEFQKRYVPNVENHRIVSVRRAASGFALQTEDGESFTARNVIVAVGITQFSYIPPVLAALPAGFVSHSSNHSDLQAFRGRRVAVVGAGASALDLAALLHEAGAAVDVIARASGVRFHDPPRRRTLRDRLMHPMTGLGAGMQLLFYVHAPRIFRLLPRRIRIDRVRKTLGPAPGWFIRDRVVGKVPLHLGVEITGASATGDQVTLQLTGRDGQQQTLQADQVIAATGYRVDLQRLAFLEEPLRRQIRTLEGAPVLSSCFGSSVPGLYFVGVAAAYSFGPMMRFAYGCDYVARRLSRHFARLLCPRPAAEMDKPVVQVLERT